MAVALSGCTYSQDAIFPSLFGSDIQEQAAENQSNAGIVLGTTNFEPVNVSEVSNTGTFVGQKVMTFRGELNQLQNSIRVIKMQLESERKRIEEENKAAALKHAEEARQVKIAAKRFEKEAKRAKKEARKAKKRQVLPSTCPYEAFWEETS